MKATNSRYNIPIWLEDYCAIDKNKYPRWADRACFVQRKDDNWALATDTFGCVGVKLPWEEQGCEKYLEDIRYLESIHRIFNEFLDMKPVQQIDINKLKSKLTLLSRQCFICNNTQLVDCTICELSTEVQCDDCKGEGSLPCITCKKPDQCKKCDGLGVVECPFCDEGKKACDCTLPNTISGANLSLGDSQILINVKRLKELLLYFHDKGSVVITDKLILIRTENKIAILNKLHNFDKYNYPEASLDEVI